MRRIIKMLIVVMIILLLVIIFIVAKKNFIKKSLNIEATYNDIQNENNDFYEHDTYAFDSIGLKLAQKNNDWSKYHLSKSFKEKYNEKDGIFGDIQFDKIEFRPYQDGKYAFEDYSYLVITQGLKKTVYTFSIFNAIDGFDIRWGDTIPLTDEFGNELDAIVTFNKDNYEHCFNMLTGNDEEMVAVSDKFYNKYKYFDYIFIHYSPNIKSYFIAEKSSWDNKEAYFKVYNEYECIERHYIVDFTINDYGYLDDVKVNLVGEYPYNEGMKEAWIQVFYNNSNWKYLKLTADFYSKYENQTSIYDDINKVDIDNSGYDFVEYNIKNPNDDIIFRAKYYDGSIHWLYLDFTYEEHGYDDKYLDDVNIIELEYKGDNIEEAKRICLERYVD